jgi:outer membrane protein
MRNLFIIIMLLFHSMVYAEIKHPQVLEGFFQIALQHSPSLQVEKAKLAALVSQKRQVESFQNWDVRLKSELSYSAMKDRQFSRTANALVGTYPLYKPDVDKLVEAESYAVKSAEFAWQATRQKLFYDIASNYFEYLALQKEIVFLEQEADSLKSILEQLNQRLELGQQNLSRIATTQGELDSNQESLLVTLEKKWQLQIEMETLAGKQVLFQSMKAPNLPLLIPENQALEQVVLNHPVLKSMQMQTREQEKKILYQKHKEGLRLDAFVSGVYNDSDSQFYDDMQGLKGGLKLEVPLYLGGRVDADIAKARANKQQIQASYRQEKLKLLAVAKTAHLIYNSSLGRIKAIQSSIHSYQQVIEAIETGILSGKQDSLEILKAERRLNNAIKELKITQIKVWQKSYQFYWSIGLL